MTAGPILANTAYAVADYVAGQGIPSFHISGADDLTQRLFNPLVMRVGYTSSQSNFPAGQWAYDEGHRSAVTICPDYGFGWESCGGFVSGFTGAGGTIEEQIWHPLGTQDFSTYVTQAQALRTRGGLRRLRRWPRRDPLLGGVDQLRHAGHAAHRQLLLRRPGAPARPGRGGQRDHQLQLLDRGS